MYCFCILKLLFFFNHFPLPSVFSWFSRPTLTFLSRLTQLQQKETRPFLSRKRESEKGVTFTNPMRANVLFFSDVLRSNFFGSRFDPI